MTCKPGHFPAGRKVQASGGMALRRNYWCSKMRTFECRLLFCFLTVHSYYGEFVRLSLSGEMPTWLHCAQRCPRCLRNAAFHVNARRSSTLLDSESLLARKGKSFIGHVHLVKHCRKNADTFKADAVQVKSSGMRIRAVKRWLAFRRVLFLGGV